MGVHGVGRNAELVLDAGRGAAAGKQVQDVGLAGGEVRAGCKGRADGGGVGPGVGTGLEAAALRGVLRPRRCRGHGMGLGGAQVE